MMYAIYNNEDGKIVSTLVTNNVELVELNTDKSKQSYLQVDSNSYTHIINNEPTTIEQPVIKDFRSIRDALLRQSDYTQMSDNPLPQDIKQAWAEYRQQLRDYPATIVDPLNPPPFPTKPS